MSQTLVTRMLRNTGEIGFPTIMLAYLLKISFVAKSMILSYQKTCPSFDAISGFNVLDYLTSTVLGKESVQGIEEIAPWSIPRF